MEDEYELLLPDFKWMTERENKLRNAMRKSMNGSVGPGGGNGSLGFLKTEFEKSQRSE